jgi:uncharacterized Zn finger protein
MTITCPKCGEDVKLKQKKGLRPVGKCKKCGKYVVCTGMGLTDKLLIKEYYATLPS